MTELITKIGELWTSISGQAKLLASALAGIILIFYIFRAFTGDEQDTKSAIKNIVLWIVIVFAPSIFTFIKTAIGG